MPKKNLKRNPTEDRIRQNPTKEMSDVMCEYTRLDVERVKKVADEWIFAMDVVLDAAKMYDAAKNRFQHVMGNVTLCQCREMAVGLDIYEKSGDATILDRRRKGIDAIDAIRAQLSEKIREVKEIYYGS